MKASNNVLDFLYVEDVAYALKKFLIQTPLSGIYNIGSGKKVQINEIINLIQQKIQKNIIKKITKKKNNKSKLFFWASIKKINKNTKWKPKFSLKFAIKKTINFYVKKFES